MILVTEIQTYRICCIVTSKLNLIDVYLVFLDFDFRKKFCKRYLKKCTSFLIKIRVMCKY